MLNFTDYFSETALNIEPNKAYIYKQMDMDVVEIKGKDSLAFLQRMTTNDVKDIAPNSAITTIFTNDKGRIIDKVFLVSFSQKYLLVYHKVYREKLTAWIEKYIILDDVSLDHSQEYFVWQLWNASISNADILSFTEKEVTWVIGESKYECETLASAKNINEIKLCSDEAYEDYRIQNCIAKAPNELSDTVNPHEVNLIDYVDFSKGCYVGQEVIARLDTYDKVQKHLRKFSSASQIDTNAVIFDENNKKAGIVTSTLQNTNGTIGLLLLSKKFNTGTKFFTENKSVIRL